VTTTRFCAIHTGSNIRPNHPMEANPSSSNSSSSSNNSNSHADVSFVKQASMAKLYCSQVAEKTASKTIEWLGGIGFTKDLGAEKFYRDCKVGSIYEGTSNMQLQTIARLLRAENATQ